jgi:hypothetical protein
LTAAFGAAKARRRRFRHGDVEAKREVGVTPTLCPQL